MLLFINRLVKALNPKRAMYLLQKLDELDEYKSWERRQFAPPSPDFIKQACVIRNGLNNATWVETGTYFGKTTKKLSQTGKMVYSIEPEPMLFSNAKKALQSKVNVEIINGLSEQVLPNLLPKLRGDICFWLDGHFSAGITHKGPQDTPIVDELTCISKNLPTMHRVVIMVDDIRCFDPRISEYSTYPSIEFLVDWARNNDFSWYIEHDIFVAKNY